MTQSQIKGGSDKNIFVFWWGGRYLLPSALCLLQIYCGPQNLGIRTWICRLYFAQMHIVSGLRFFNEPEISNSGPPALRSSRRTCAQDFYVLKNPSTSARSEPANLGSRGELVTPRPPRPTRSWYINSYHILKCVAVTYSGQPNRRFILVLELNPSRSS